MIVAYVPDLMDRSKVSAAAGDRVRFVSSPDQLVEAEADLVIVDLSRPGVLEVLPSIETRTVGFGSHVDTERLEAARRAGCDEVLARSAFFSRLAELLA
ncbi:MAG: hypothetical protein QOG64_1821 [Acidimicrobiaceae bacterium]|nr:hypothetical protein [Acidimicrobiaceae bacterium]